jgi:hypothetical protein
MFTIRQHNSAIVFIALGTTLQHVLVPKHRVTVDDHMQFMANDACVERLWFPLGATSN